MPEISQVFIIQFAIYITFQIVDGTETETHEFPWVASLQVNGEHFCGGTLVAPNWVLTAAHCVDFGKMDTLSRLRVRPSLIYKNTNQFIFNTFIPF